MAAAVMTRSEMLLLLVLLVVPAAGTRGRSEYWKSGFYYIALGAQVPIALAFIDYAQKVVGIGPSFMPTGDIDGDFDLDVRGVAAPKVKQGSVDHIPTAAAGLDIPVDQKETPLRSQRGAADQLERLGHREQLRENMDAVSQGPLNPDEMNWIRQYGRLVKSRKKLDYVK